LPEHDAGIVALDDGKAWWISEKLIEAEAQHVSIEFRSREHILDKEIRNYPLHRALPERLLGSHGQPPLAMIRKVSLQIPQGKT
jgi:hypothetical protein